MLTIRSRFDQLASEIFKFKKCELSITQGHITAKWDVWSSPKSNSSQLLCLSLLPATLTMIQSKMNELAWRQHFPIISLWEIFRRSRAANSVVSGPKGLKFKLVPDFMHVLITCKYKKDQIKNSREKVETSFSPLYINGSFLLPWKPEFWFPKPSAAFPHPSDATYKIWSRLANWLQRYSSLTWTTTDHWYTISSPCEPSAPDHCYTTSSHCEPLAQVS